MSIIYVALSAFGGGIVSGLLGWADSNEPFIGRKFLGTALRSILAGVVFAGGYIALSGTPTLADLGTAFLAGAGIDVGLKRIAGTVSTTKV